ncbi:pentapeptide repeat-containing protein [Halococcus thailandensis]|uniref:pentapeptide repeat-containing protein n=1 Tax=Halococcus thailandensis TaxID=335952 RepID=UPI0009B5A857|nr:pentapeptide repeat-containing protein [Halococcus thailandensis]
MPSQWARRWGYVAKDAPTGRCGVTIKFLHTDETGPVSDVTCWRDSWKDFDQCVWHADTDNKPRDDLAEARTEYPERLDGAIIQGNNMGSSISFANCRMNGAELTDANFSMADFSNAMLRYATLDETQFFQTNFSRANLSQATLEKVNLQNADLTHTPL